MAPRKHDPVWISGYIERDGRRIQDVTVECDRRVLERATGLIIKRRADAQDSICIAVKKHFPGVWINWEDNPHRRLRLRYYFVLEEVRYPDGRVFLYLSGRLVSKPDPSTDLEADIEANIDEANRLFPDTFRKKTQTAEEVCGCVPYSVTTK